MVYLVGAGTGAAGLITQTGLELLKRCDAVVYDRLGTGQLLGYVRTDCRKIYVGKRAGAHTRTQPEINEILAELGKNYDCVVRLKGGDPFVFGRAAEEIETLRAHRIPYKVVPGVTSAVAVPELAGIPVTHRNVSRSFHVITGHTSDGKLDLEQVQPYAGTSIYLMGLGNLERIVQRLLARGMQADTPVAVVSRGSTPFQQVIRGNLTTIVHEVQKKNSRLLRR